MPLRSFTEAEIIVSERKRLERPLVVLAWLGIVLFSLAEGSVFYLLAGTAAAGVKLQAVNRGKELYIRRLFVNIGVLMATGVVLVSLFIGAVDPVIALGHYLILILLCKLFERSRNRDYVQMITLGLLMAMSASLFCDELWFATLLVGYLALASYTTMVLTLKRGLDSAAAASLTTEAGPMPAHKVAWNVRRGWPARSLRRLLVVTVPTMLSMGVLIFLVAPRTHMAAGAARTRGERSSAAIGYSSSVELGDARSIYLSNRVAMRVRLLASDPCAALPADGLYLRGHTFEIYSASKWTGRTGEAAVPFPNPQPHGGGLLPAGSTVRQEISMVRSLLPALFASHPAVSVQTDPHIGEPYMTGTGDLRLTPAPDLNQWVEYVVESWAGPLTAPQRQYLAIRRLRVPGVERQWAVDATPPVRELAHQWCEDLLAKRAADPQRGDELDLAIAERLADKLRQQYHYSLDLSTSNPERDGVEDFLLHMKQGHCEYFASALTVMCNCLGVRARLATGFHLDRSCLEGDVYVVRDRHAHAWTEVYTPQSDWVVVEATPAGEPSPVPQPWWGALSRLWIDAHQFWRDRFVGYGERERLFLASWVRRQLRAAGDALASWGRALGRGMEDLLAHGFVDRAVLQVALALGLAGLGAEAVVLVRLIRRRTHRKRHLRRAVGPRWKQTRFILRLLKLLERRGFPHQAHETPMETAQRAAEGLNLPAEEFAGLVRLYYRLRWGGQEAPAEEIRAADEKVKELARTLRGQARSAVAFQPASR
ncbi:MAG TPA: DUF3488 and transglutaminase-like domain-containing protein [Phycisphaerae bacterium]|nr:DUF3488 and transglutaminase-like domain-containing protein [Phycisphaerae bacterium]